MMNNEVSGSAYHQTQNQLRLLRTWAKTLGYKIEFTDEAEGWLIGPTKIPNLYTRYDKDGECTDRADRCPVFEFYSLALVEAFLCGVM